MFTFAGYLLSESNASQRLAKLTQTLFGWMPAGLAVVTIMACAFFTGLTGASGMTIIAIGALLYPALRQMNYSDRFSLGLVTTSGSLGLLFPPSVALILYGIVAPGFIVPPIGCVNPLRYRCPANGFGHPR
jgi:TRAP-type C4-dicarboxylate transport system permease large subunit